MKTEITRTELWEIIHISKSSHRHPPDADKVIEMMCVEMCVKKSLCISDKISNEIKVVQEVSSHSKRKRARWSEIYTRRKHCNI